MSHLARTISLQPYRLGLVVAALVVLGGQAAAADYALPPEKAIVACRHHDEAQELKDSALLAQAAQTLTSGGASELEPVVPDLEAAFAHAPDVPPWPERCGDAIHVYSDEPETAASVTAYLKATPGMDKVTVVQHPSLPYAMIGYVIGWYRFEQEDFDAAHAAYSKGLRNNPNQYMLVSEDGLTLSHLHRNAEGLALIDDFLAGHTGLPVSQMTPLLNNRAYILVELKRLDEAEAVYHEVLRIDPDNVTAPDELLYIASLRGQ